MSMGKVQVEVEEEDMAPLPIYESTLDLISYPARYIQNNPMKVGVLTYMENAP